MTGAVAIDVWHIEATARHPLGESLLSPAERERGDRFRDAGHGQRWRYFRTALRDILATYLDREAGQLRFDRVARDKPVLGDAPELFFNLSHSGARGLLRVSRRAPVGIDIEYRRHLPDRAALSRRNFSRREQRALAAIPQSDQAEAFFGLWTRKEAVIKADGRGLGVPLADFDVPCGALHGWQRVAGTDTPLRRDFYLCELQVASGFTGALAMRVPRAKPAADMAVRMHHYQPR